MKTLSYNTEKEIRVGFMIIVIITAVLTTFKIRELQLSDASNAEASRVDRIEMTDNNVSSMPIADARLIEEPAQATETNGTANSVSGNEKELAVQLKTWMSNKTYWNDEQAENEQALVHYMTNCLYNGTFFSDKTFDELPTENLTELKLSIISNLKNGSYFSDETIEEVAADNTEELAGQMKLTLASGNYWNADYK